MPFKASFLKTERNWTQKTPFKIKPTGKLALALFEWLDWKKPYREEKQERPCVVKLLRALRGEVKDKESIVSIHVISASEHKSSMLMFFLLFLSWDRQTMNDLSRDMIQNCCANGDLKKINTSFSWWKITRCRLWFYWVNFSCMNKGET